MPDKLSDEQGGHVLYSISQYGSDYAGRCICGHSWYRSQPHECGTTCPFCVYGEVRKELAASLTHTPKLAFDGHDFHVRKCAACDQELTA